MKLLKDHSDECEIDILEMVDKIDDIFHTYVTDFNGCTISHSTINMFVWTIVKEINKDIQLRRDEFNRAVEYERLEREEINKQVRMGKVILDTDGIINNIKYRHLGYVLDTASGGRLYDFKC